MNQHLPKKKNLSIMTILSLVRESKKKGINESDVWKTILKHRWDINILKTNSCLIEDQKADVIYKTTKDLRLHYGFNNWIPEEDLKLATELFSAITYCPQNLIEAAKLSKLFESLLTNENLNTHSGGSHHAKHPTKGWRQHQGLHCNQHVVPEAGRKVQLLLWTESPSLDDN